VSYSPLFTPALLRTHSFVFFAVHETRRILPSPFISKASRRFLNFFSECPAFTAVVATGHTSAFIIHIFVESGMLWLFHIFCSAATIACPLFNLVRNSVVHSPSSVTRDQIYGNVSTCSSCSYWMSMLHTMPSLAITLGLSTLMIGCIYGWLGLSDPPTPVVLPSKWPTGWCHQRYVAKVCDYSSSN